MDTLIGEKVVVRTKQYKGEAVFLGWGNGFKMYRNEAVIGQFTVAMIQIGSDIETALPSEIYFPKFDKDDEQEGLPPESCITTEEIAFIMGWRGDFERIGAVNWPFPNDKAADQAHAGLAARTVWDSTTDLGHAPTVRCPYLENSPNAIAWTRGFMGNLNPNEAISSIEIEGTEARYDMKVVYVK